MGRELKRVALDFNWELNKVWDGYRNPYYKKCPACDGSGDTTAMRALNSIVYDLLALSYRIEEKDISEDIIELTVGLAGREPSSFGHDSIDNWNAIKKIVKAAGLRKCWGRCKKCGGTGRDPEFKSEYKKWKPTDPTAGEGYQIWETVSEGSPISPVFDTPEKLAEYMAGRKWGADPGSSYEAWLGFINGPGWAPSFVMVLQNEEEKK